MSDLYAEDKALQLLFNVSFKDIRDFQNKERALGKQPTEFLLPTLDATVYGLKLKVTP